MTFLLPRVDRQYGESLLADAWMPLERLKFAVPLQRHRSEEKLSEEKVSLT